MFFSFKKMDASSSATNVHEPQLNRQVIAERDIRILTRMGVDRGTSYVVG
jgi:hypothetical protein